MWLTGSIKSQLLSQNLEYLKYRLAQDTLSAVRSTFYGENEYFPILRNFEGGF